MHACSRVIHDSSQVLQEMLGERVDARVRKVTEYGAFLTFPVEVYAGYSLEMFGLLHRSKMGDLSLESLQVWSRLVCFPALSVYCKCLQAAKARQISLRLLAAFRHLLEDARCQRTANLSHIGGCL